MKSIKVIDVNKNIDITEEEYHELVDSVNYGFAYYFEIYNKKNNHDILMHMLMCSQLKKLLSFNNDDHSVHLSLDNLINLVIEYSFYCNQEKKLSDMDEQIILLSKLNQCINQARIQKVCIYE